MTARSPAAGSRRCSSRRAAQGAEPVHDRMLEPDADHSVGAGERLGRPQGALWQRRSNGPVGLRGDCDRDHAAMTGERRSSARKGPDASPARLGLRAAVREAGGRYRRGPLLRITNCRSGPLTNSVSAADAPRRFAYEFAFARGRLGRAWRRAGSQPPGRARPDSRRWARAEARRRRCPARSQRSPRGRRG
jgi:hypothetical protein